MLNVIDTLWLEGVEDIVEEHSSVAVAAVPDEGIMMVAVIQWNPWQGSPEIIMIPTS